MRVNLVDAEATEALAQCLARHAPSVAVVHLLGQLGAGKSTLARAWLRSLGVHGAIKSPTYTLIERYDLHDGCAAHLDLYRIAAADELEFLGLDELAADAKLWLIEWPERGGRALPVADLAIQLSVVGEGREALLEPRSESGRAWLARVAKEASLPEPS